MKIQFEYSSRLLTSSFGKADRSERFDIIVVDNDYGVGRLTRFPKVLIFVASKD